MSLSLYKESKKVEQIMPDDLPFLCEVGGLLRLREMLGRFQ